jgi:hypothetical protein
MPDVLEINDPPIIVINKKYKLKLSDFIKVRPELDKLLITLIIKSRPLLLLRYTNNIKITDKNSKYKSSLCSLDKTFLSKILNNK